MQRYKKNCILQTQNEDFFLKDVLRGGNREQGRVLILFKHSNIQTFLTSSLPLPRITNHQPLKRLRCGAYVRSRRSGVAYSTSTIKYAYARHRDCNYWFRILPFLRRLLPSLLTHITPPLR